MEELLINVTENNVRQVHYRLRFILRCPKSDRLTNIYGSVWINGRGYKIPTGVKVVPSQWSTTKQVAVISNLQSKVDNHNNKVANDRIEEIKARFSKYLSYLCETNVKCSIDKLTEFIGGMKQTITATELITKAFDYLHPKPKEVIGRVDTRRVYLSRLNSYLDYLKEKKLTKLDVFTQAGLNAYTRYLLDKGESISSVNFKCELIVRLVNKVIAVEEPFIKYKVSGGLVYNKKKDNRKDKGRFALTQEEIQALEKVEIDTKIKYSYSDIVPFNIQKVKGKVLEEYRDIFCLQCHIGQRSSDMVQLLEYIVGVNLDRIKRIEADGETYLELKTKKSKYKESALILVDDYLESFIAKYRNGFELKLKELDSGRLYNYGIRLLAKFAGIDREITYRNAQDEEITEPAYLKISSHCARHTYITNKLREGVNPERLIYTTGHSSDVMVRKIYNHLTSTDKAKMITKELGKIRKDKAVENPPTTAKIEEGFKYAGFKKTETLRIDKVELVGDKRCVAALKYIHAKQNSIGDISKWLSKNNIELSEIIKALIQAEVMCVGDDKAELSKWEKYLFTLQGNLLKMNELAKMWNS